MLRFVNESGALEVAAWHTFGANSGDLASRYNESLYMSLISSIFPRQAGRVCN